MAGLLKRVTADRGALVIVAVFLAAYAYRPFVLGFYHDDWYVLVGIASEGGGRFSPGRLGALMDAFFPRPAAGLLNFLVSSLAGESPWAWQVFGAAVALGSAFVLRGFLRRLLAAADLDAGPMPTVAACCWLLFPWGVPNLAWPIMFVPSLSLVFFCASGWILLDGWAAGKNRLVWPAVLYMVSCLIYEAFYGQFLLFLLVPLLNPRLWRSVGVRAIVLQGLSFLVVQALVLGWNRIRPYYSTTYLLEGQRWQIVLNNLTGFHRPLLASLAEGAGRLRLLLRTGAEVGAAAVVVLLLTRERRAQALRGLGLLAVCGLGMVASLAVFGLAGYTLQGRGIYARTTLSLNLWLAVALCVGLALVAGLGREWRRGAVLFGALLAVLLARGSGERVRDWARVWRMERHLLKHVPVEDLRQAKADAVVITRGACEQEGVTGFGSLTDLNSAMHYSFPALRALRFRVGRFDWQTTWDGHAYQVRNPAPVFREEADEVWVWDPATGLARPAAVPLRLP